MVKVLIVEDNALAARMAQQVLKKIHCASDVAASAESAIRAISAAQYDLVLMDLGLPDRSGFELAKRIRGLPNLQALPIIALTGHMSFGKKTSCLEAGMQDMVTKPISLSVAEALLQKWVVEKVPLGELATFDLQEGADLSGGGELSAKELIELLIASLPTVLQTLAILQQQKNYASISNEVHKLYGGLCYVGVPKLREIVRCLNSALEDFDHPENINQLLMQLQQEAEKIIADWDLLS